MPKVCRPFSGTSLKTQLNCRGFWRESQWNN
nr:MAG TPA: hypothetical protein [Caudoviricetes sp.]